MQKIKLNIGNRVYPLSVDTNQEEILRKAAKQINQMINDYESKYAVRDKQDSLAMCALQILSQSKTFSNDDDKEIFEIGEKLNKIKELIDSRL
jgi:cell division protein ZapA|tara:strand:- start:463 stop:741 length:279 start_codon:yes stop_codon:yes gene_type:complete